MRNNLLLGPALSAACAHALTFSYHDPRLNSSVFSTTPLSSSTSAHVFSSDTDVALSSTTASLSTESSSSTSTPISTSLSSSASTLISTSSSLSTPTLISTSFSSSTSLISTLSSSSTSTLIPTSSSSSSSLLISNSSSPTFTQSSTSQANSNGTTPGPSLCTGCILEALNPSTAFFDDDSASLWTSIVVTKTILTNYITYMVGSVIDTVTIELQTLNQTKTVTGIANQTIVHTTPMITIEPSPGVSLTLPAGPTYLIYTGIYGGLERDAFPPNTAASTNEFLTQLFPNEAQPTCRSEVQSLSDLLPTREQDWHYFIQTVTDAPDDAQGTPLPLPPALVDFLKQDPDVTSHFSDSDIAKCTPRTHATPTPEPSTALSLTSVPMPVQPSNTPIGTPRPPPPPRPTGLPPNTINPPIESEPPAPEYPEPIFTTMPVETYISTTYASTSSHITRRGCLRCDSPTIPVPQPPFSIDTGPEMSRNMGLGPSEEASRVAGPSRVDARPPVSQTPDKPQPPVQTQYPEPEQSQDLAGFLASFLHNPAFTPTPQPQNSPDNPQPQRTYPGQTITIGDKTFEIHPAQQTQVQQTPAQQDPAQATQEGQLTQPGQPNQPYNPGQQSDPAPVPGIVIGSETLTPGQTTTINGVPVIVPTDGGGSSIIVDGSTIAVQAAPTSPPVLTIGAETVTANPQGQFVVGGETLTPGGPAITVDGSTLSLGPSGTIAVVNGVTQTLANAPFVTGAPAITVDGQTISATVIGGSTLFVLDNDNTLTPGGVVTVDGTTFSMPADSSGSTVIVNGVTSTLHASGLPILTLSGQSVTPWVHDGTTAFVIAPGQTLTPGGIVTIDGTTLSLPADGSGSTIVVNGVTSTLAAPGLPILTLNSDSVTASVQDGTTAFVFAPGQTLTPGGVITHSGTIFSMPASASGTVVIINGVTSTLGQPPVTAAAALTMDGTTYPATVREGTTEYVLNSETTLRPGDAITVSGTTYSLDERGTALVINGKTSTMPTLPASISAKTTRAESRTLSTSASVSESASESTSQSSSSSSESSARNPGNFIASGIGLSTNGGGMRIAVGGGVDTWIEGLVIGFAGWMLMLV